MLLAVDIGNSAIKFGVYDGELLLSRFSIPTKHDYTASEVRQAVADILPLPVKDAIACSVVPEADAPLTEFIRQSFDIETDFVTNEFDFGLKINYEPISAVGTDRLIAVFAAAESYGTPVIVCDFGTATTIDAVNSKREYLGGIIAPGMNTLAEALHLKTSKLPRVSIEKPLKVIGNTTVRSIQSGTFYGYIGLVEGILMRMTGELSEPAQVIATGGFAKMIAAECPSVDIVDENLTLDGLRLLQLSIKQHSPKT